MGQKKHSTYVIAAVDEKTLASLNELESARAKFVSHSIAINNLNSRGYVSCELKEWCKEEPVIEQRTWVLKSLSQRVFLSQENLLLYVICSKHYGSYRESETNADWNAISVRRFGGCFLKVQKQYSKRAPVNNPMTDILYGDNQSAEQSDCVLESKQGLHKLRLQVSFNKPKDFQQENTRIVKPKMEVSEFTKLELTANCGPSTCSTSMGLELSGIVVCLLEVSASKTTTTSTAKYVLRQKTLLNTKLKQKLNWNGSVDGAVAPLQFLLQNCVLPDLEASQFASHYWRTYGIKITIKLSSKKTSLELPVFMEVAVGYEDRYHIELTRFQMNPPDRDFVLFKKLFEPRLTQLYHRTLLMTPDFGHRGLHTDTFSIDGTTVAVTNGKVVRQIASDIMKDKAFDDKLILLGYMGVRVQPKVTDDENYIICKVCKGSDIVTRYPVDPDEMYGGLFLVINRCLVHYNFPFAMRTEKRVFENTPLLELIFIDSVFKSGTTILDERHVIVVDSYLIASVGLLLCFNNPQYRHRKHVVLTCYSVNVVLQEYFTSNDKEKGVDYSDRMWGLFKNPFMSVTTRVPLDKTMHGMPACTIPPEWYNCAVHSCGPTFFSETLNRQFRILVEFELSLDCEPSATFFHYIPVDIAAHPDDDATSLPPPPPPYEVTEET